MTIVWSPTARNKIHEILEYISKDNPNAAITLIDEFNEKVEKLKNHPEAGRIVRETKNEKIRELVVHKHYGVIYEITDVIEILTVRHFRQDFSDTKL